MPSTDFPESRRQASNAECYSDSPVKSCYNHVFVQRYQLSANNENVYSGNDGFRKYGFPQIHRKQFLESDEFLESVFIQYPHDTITNTCLSIFLRGYEFESLINLELEKERESLLSVRKKKRFNLFSKTVSLNLCDTKLSLKFYVTYN